MVEEAVTSETQGFRRKQGRPGQNWKDVVMKDRKGAEHRRGGTALI